MPLVNVPMIDYTLAWLESAGVEEVFVFCCAHSRQVTDYLTNSKWFSQPNFSIKTIESHNCVSAGDALRFIYEQHVVCQDLSFYIFSFSFSFSFFPLESSLLLMAFAFLGYTSLLCYMDSSK